MLATIFSLLLTAIVVVTAFYLVCGAIGVILGVISCILRSVVFWFAVTGGLVMYLHGYRTDGSLMLGMVIGAIIGVIFMIWNPFEDF